MHDFKKGDRVKVIIEDAEITNVASNHITIQKPWKAAYGHTIIDPTHPNVTVTRIAEQPRAGDTWKLAPDIIVQVAADSFDAGELWTLDPHDRRISKPIRAWDWEGAELLYRLDTTTPTPQGQ